MADTRVALTVQTPPGKYPASISAGAADYTFTALSAATDDSGTDGVTDGTNVFSSAGGAFSADSIGHVLLVAGIPHVVRGVIDALTVVLDGSPMAPDTGLTWSILKGNKFASNGREILVVKNTHATDPKWVMVPSPVAAAALFRLGSIFVTIPAGGRRIFGPFAINGWPSGGAAVTVVGESADIQVAVDRMPVGL